MGVASDEKHDASEAVSDPQPGSTDEKPRKSSTEIPDDAAPAEQKSASVGASNKRRFAKIVGDEDEGTAKSHNEDSARTMKKAKAKKGKKVKLSFAEEASET